ncbi:hypothetical protein ScPMuIL_012273 [Solemya velum]
MVEQLDVPIIDFSVYSETGVVGSEGERQLLAKELCQALGTVGFCYLKNHGFSTAKEQSFFKESSEFFQLPKEVKRKYARQSTTNHGWVHIEGETLNPDRPGDLKEVFNICHHSVTKDLPEEPPNFKTSCEQFFDECMKLTGSVLDALSIGLKLKVKFLKKCHSSMGKKNSFTTLRTLFYPCQAPAFKAGQICCGEHSDYGTITLLFQDDVGGLQALRKDGVYVDVKPVPGTIVLNIGDALQRWSADQLVATKHRVVPESQIQKQTSRQSIVFFVHPDDDVMMECLDGSRKYEPITSGEYTRQRFNATY